jgi:hypothetical protein
MHTAPLFQEQKIPPLGQRTLHEQNSWKSTETTAVIRSGSIENAGDPINVLELVKQLPVPLIAVHSKWNTEPEV